MNKIKKLMMTLTLAAALVFPMVSPQQGNPTVVSAATIKINTKSLTLVKGSSKTLSILGTKKKVTWKSSKPSIATVSTKGKVTAKKAGTTTITATVSKKKYTCKVTVKNPIRISATSCTLVEGKTKTLSISGTTQKVTWKSSRTSVATVSSKGKVTAKKSGTATITATVNKKNYTCKVTVKKPIRISATSCTLVEGKTKTLSISGTTQKVTWKSSKTSVATVSSKGKVTAKKSGTATITATVNKKNYTCKVTVKNPVNKYVAPAPYKAVERTFNAFNFVVPKDWSFEKFIDSSDISMGILTPNSSEGSNVIILCEKTGEDALDYTSLKETMDKEYSPEILNETYSSLFEDENIKVKDYIAQEFKTLYGSAYKVSYSLDLPAGLESEDLADSLALDDSTGTTTEPMTLKETMYTISIKNYSITIVATDIDNMNLESVTDYIMKTFTLDK